MKYTMVTDIDYIEAFGDYQQNAITVPHKKVGDYVIGYDITALLFFILIVFSSSLQKTLIPQKKSLSTKKN